MMMKDYSFRGMVFCRLCGALMANKNTSTDEPRCSSMILKKGLLQIFCDRR